MQNFLGNPINIMQIDQARKRRRSEENKASLKTIKFMIWVEIQNNL